jgi:glyoxylase-like metal-dependent hydrolase (beta-lactamase superfamily II)
MLSGPQQIALEERETTFMQDNQNTSVKSYSFRVGSVNCTVLLDGAWVLGAEGMVERYPNGTEDAYRQAYSDIGLSLDEADNSMNILVARIGDDVVLFDTGSGVGDKPDGGYLLDSLQQAGISPESITLVVLTHADGDHVLGLLSEDQQPVFPNATYVISREELAFWQGRIETSRQTQRPIVEMMQAKGLRLINMDEQILPGLTAVPMPGHKPGQIGLLLTSDDQGLLHLADVLHSPMQFAHPEWCPTFDVDPETAVQSRVRGLDMAARDKLLTLFYHLTFPGLGYIERAQGAEQRFVWKPVEVS